MVFGVLASQFSPSLFCDSQSPPPHRPRELHERGGGLHQDAQDRHAAGVCQELDVPKGMERLDAFISIMFFP
jgi:hypothetical protein